MNNAIWCTKNFYAIQIRVQTNMQKIWCDFIPMSQWEIIELGQSLSRANDSLYPTESQKLRLVVNSRKSGSQLLWPTHSFEKFFNSLDGSCFICINNKLWGFPQIIWKKLVKSVQLSVHNFHLSRHNACNLAYVQFELFQERHAEGTCRPDLEFTFLKQDNCNIFPKHLMRNLSASG